jgi:hypothetical protein
MRKEGEYMATNVTWHYEFGLALDEAAFNLISAGLFISRPELFSYSTDITVKPADPGPPPVPAHVLTVYAVADKPFSFSLYPVAGLPTLPEDSLMVQGDISFTLTDSILGTITRVGITFQATASVSLSNSVGTLKVLSFALTDIRGEQPNLAALTRTSAMQSNVATITEAPLSDDGALGRTFKALVNYLEELYLNMALEKAVTQFPVPPLNQLTGFGALGTLPVDVLAIRNKAFYSDIGNDLGAPAAFPDPSATPVDLRIGVSQTGLRRVVNALLPLPVPLEVGGVNNTLHLTSNLSIPEIDLKLNAGSTEVPVSVHLAGLMNLHVKIPIPVFGGNLEFDVPLPIDPLTQYAGKVIPAVQVDDPSTSGAQVRLLLTPETGFLQEWYALVVTDYRDYLAKAFRNAAHNAANQLIGNKFCDVPILGWIVCGLIDVTADVVGYLTGAVLDFFISSFLTAIVNTIGRIILAFLQAPNFNVFHINQADLMKLMGISVKSAQIEVLDNGRDADLQADLWFQDQGLPVPIPPQPIQPLPPPQPEPTPPYPGATTLPEYAAPAFLPTLALQNPTWTDGQTQTFTLTTQTSHSTATGTVSVSFSHTAGRWQVRNTISDSGGNKLTDSWAQYDETSFQPVRSDQAAYYPTGVVRQTVDFSITPGQIVASVGLDGQPSDQNSTLLRDAIPVDFDEFWVHRFAAAPMTGSEAGKFGRAGLVSPRSAINWVREIPVTVSAADGTLDWGPAGGPSVPAEVWVLSGSDEQCQIQAWIAKDGRGLLKLQSTVPDGNSVLIRQ